MAAERRFRAMGSSAHVVVVGAADALLDAAVSRIEELERRWSRFRPDSEISTLNRHAGEWVRVSADTRTLVATAVAGWRRSGGAFDPTLLEAVVAAGYDRSFDSLGVAAPETAAASVAAGARDAAFELLGAGAVRPTPAWRPMAGPRAFEIECDGERLRLPAGAGFDPGGIGKGLAADVVAAMVMDAGADGVCVNLGGDLRVAGSAPRDGAWTVAVEHPWHDHPLVRVGLSDGAIATSTTLIRTWTLRGTSAHHLIDPRTGMPTDGRRNFATVIAARAADAEVLAKAVLLAAPAHPFDILGGTGAEGLAVDATGAVAASAGFTRFCGTQTLPRLLPAPAQPAAASCSHVYG